MHASHAQCSRHQGSSSTRKSTSEPCHLLGLPFVFDHSFAAPLRATTDEAVPPEGDLMKQSSSPSYESSLITIESQQCTVQRHTKKGGLQGQTAHYSRKPGNNPPPPCVRVRMSSGERPIGAAKGKQSDTEALCQTPPPLRKQQESQENDGHPGSWCLDKAVLPRDRAVPKERMSPKTCPYLTLSTIVGAAFFNKFWRSSLPIRGIRSCGIEALSNLAPHLEQLHMPALWGRLWSRSNDISHG